MKKIQISLPTLTVAFVGLAMVIQLLTPDSVLRADVTTSFANYSDIMLSGEIPYLDFDFEHLPLGAVPIILPGVLERFMPWLTYQSAFVLFSTLALVGIALTLRRAGSEISDDLAAQRWLIIAAPLFPFVLYRIDAWSVLLASLALVGANRVSTRRYVSIVMLGVAVKGWPALFAIGDWLESKHRQAILIVGGSAVLGAVLLLLPGFRSGRSFDGVHLGTFSGSLTLLARLVRDVPHGLQSSAGALYVEVGVWAHLVNVLVGVAIWTTTLLLHRRKPMTRPLLLTLTILGLLLASPLLSAQFLLWLTPFVALVRYRVPGMVVAVAGAITTLLVIWWRPTHEFWATLMVVRNVLLVALALVLVQLARHRPSARRTASL